MIVNCDGYIVGVPSEVGASWGVNAGWATAFTIAFNTLLQYTVCVMFRVKRYPILVIILYRKFFSSPYPQVVFKVTGPSPDSTIGIWLLPDYLGVVGIFRAKCHFKTE